MSNKYHIAATGKNAGQYVPCDAKVNCRIGGEHLNADQAQAKNIMLAGEALLDSGTNTSKFQTFMEKRREKAAAKKAAYDALPLYMKNPMFAPTDVEVCEKCGGRIGALEPNSLLAMRDLPVCEGH